MLFEQTNYVRQCHGFYGRLRARFLLGLEDRVRGGITPQLHTAIQRPQHTVKASRTPKQGCIISGKTQNISSHLQPIISKFIQFCFSVAGGGVHAPVWQVPGPL